MLGTFAKGTTADIDDAVAAARAAQPAWAATPWQERLTILRRAAELISDRLMDYSAAMAIEVGKNRIEALGEVEESADLIRYYAQTMEDNGGYDHPMDNLGDKAVHTRSILRPHGVFAVVSPFNFPMALATGPSSAAMMAGNTVVIKPASASPLSAQNMLQAYIDAGVPKGVVNLVMGPGDSVGQALQDHTGIDGIVFTGSYDVGMKLFHSFSKDWPRPCIVEMGGKNPAIVSRHADLDEAAEGIMRSAFGFGGQKCSANSRVYVERPVHDELVQLLVEKTEQIVIGDPLERANWLGPIIDQKAVDRHQKAVSRGASRRPGVHRRRAPHRRRPVARLLRRADGRRRAAVRPSRVPRRVLRAADGGPCGRLARRGADPGQRHDLRADRRHLLGGQGRGADVPRPDPGRARSTSTGAPARRPGRGRACRRSVAGRGAARPARPACRCTTSRSSCGSRATPSSTEAAPLGGAGARSRCVHQALGTWRWDTV